MKVRSGWEWPLHWNQWETGGCRETGVWWEDVGPVGDKPFSTMGHGNMSQATNRKWSFTWTAKTDAHLAIWLWMMWMNKRARSIPSHWYLSVKGRAAYIKENCLKIILLEMSNKFSTPFGIAALLERTCDEHAYANLSPYVFPQCCESRTKFPVT